MTSNPYQPPGTETSRVERKKRPIKWKRIALMAFGVELVWCMAFVVVDATRPAWLWESGAWYLMGGAGVTVSLVAAALFFVSAVGWAMNRD